VAMSPSRNTRSGPPPRRAAAGLAARCGSNVTLALVRAAARRPLNGRHASAPRRVASRLSMSAFDPLVRRLQPHEPTPPVWRMPCLCSFRAGTPGEIAACACCSWWRVSRRGRWYAIYKRRAFRALLPGLRRELRYFELTGRWPAKGFELLSRRSPPRRTARRVPPSRCLAARRPSWSRSRSAEPGRS